MMHAIKKLTDLQKIINYLKEVDNDFGIPISNNNSIELFASKLVNKGNIFAIVENEDIVSFIGFYCNDTTTLSAHLPILSTKEMARGKGYARILVNKMIEVCKNEGMKVVYCDSINPYAIALYKSIGFIIYNIQDNKTFLKLDL